MLMCNFKVYRAAEDNSNKEFRATILNKTARFSYITRWGGGQKKERGGKKGRGGR